MKTERIELRVTPELKNALIKAAEKDGRKVSNYVELILIKHINKSK